MLLSQYKSQENQESLGQMKNESIEKHDTICTSLSIVQKIDSPERLSEVSYAVPIRYARGRALETNQSVGNERNEDKNRIIPD